MLGNADTRPLRPPVQRRKVSCRPWRTSPYPRKCFLVCAAKPDPWRTLGVERDADEQTIKKAYRKAALRSHPDQNKDPGAAATFLRIQGAYEVLTGRRRDSTAGKPADASSWDFHDWYWQFSTSQRWAKRKVHKAQAAASAAARPASEQRTRAQLDGLRRRAAFRQRRAHAAGDPEGTRGAAAHSWADSAPASATSESSKQHPTAAGHDTASTLPDSASIVGGAAHAGHVPDEQPVRPSCSYQVQDLISPHRHQAVPAERWQTCNAPIAEEGPSSLTSGPGRPINPSMPSSNPSWGFLEAQLKMMSLSLLHINLRLAATVPVELPGSQARHDEAPALVTGERLEQQAENLGAQPGHDRRQVPVHSGMQADSHHGQQQGQDAGSLEGLQGVQSQLAGLRRKAAMRAARAQ